MGSDVYVVVLIGGKGKRLRPLSSNARPKAFLSVTKDRLTMFGRSVRRARTVAPLRHLVVVANRTHASLVRHDVPALRSGQILYEPLSRNTAPAIALAARRLEAVDPEAIMVVLPTDQYLVHEARYVAAVKKAVAFVRRTPGATVVLGHRPSYPATGFGYVRVTGRGSRGTMVRKVLRFTEKPDAATAARYVKSGAYLWNMGAFIFRVDTILRHLERLAPAVYRGIGDGSRITHASYKRLPDISIDYAVMERAGGLYCVPGDFGWQDMGNFDALRVILRREGRRFCERGGKIVKII